MQKRRGHGHVKDIDRVIAPGTEVLQKRRVCEYAQYCKSERLLFELKRMTAKEKEGWAPKQVLQRRSSYEVKRKCQQQSPRHGGDGIAEMRDGIIRIMMVEQRIERQIERLIPIAAGAKPA